jgi:hypothetical protein
MAPGRPRWRVRCSLVGSVELRWDRIRDPRAAVAGWRRGFGRKWRVTGRCEYARGLTLLCRALQARRASIGWLVGLGLSPSRDALGGCVCVLGSLGLAKAGERLFFHGSMAGSVFF